LTPARFHSPWHGTPRRTPPCLPGLSAGFVIDQRHHFGRGARQRTAPTRRDGRDCRDCVFARRSGVARDSAMPRPPRDSLPPQSRSSRSTPSHLSLRPRESTWGDVEVVAIELSIRHEPERPRGRAAPGRAAGSARRSEGQSQPAAWAATRATSRFWTRLQRRSVTRLLVPRVRSSTLAERRSAR
jgi:hypothetical protein